MGIELNAENLVQKEVSAAPKVAEVIQEDSTLNNAKELLSMVNDIVGNVAKIMDQFGISLKDQVIPAVSQPVDSFGGHQFGGGVQTIAPLPPQRRLPPSTSPPPHLPPTLEESTTYDIAIDETESEVHSFTKEQLLNALDKMIEVGGADLTLKELRELSVMLPDQVDVPSEVLNE